MLVQETHLDVVSNNLANVNTVGFRRRIPVNSEFSALIDRVEKVSEDGETKMMSVSPSEMGWKGRQLIGGMAWSTVYSASSMDDRPGMIRATEAPFDMTIEGYGFFSVQDDEGNTYYTRQGNFLVGRDGTLSTADGMSLMGAGGPIAIADGAIVQVLSNGQVIADGEVVGEIGLFTFENPSFLDQVGRNSLMTPTEKSGDAIPAEGATLAPGTIELSNVSVVEEMVRMIEAQRAYEGASKALMAHDELTGKLITSYGRQ